MIDVIFSRLLDMAGIDSEEILAWPDSLPISIDEILDARDNGICGDSTPYGDPWRYPVKQVRDKEYHIARIIYFVEHPEEISGIEVDNLCSDNRILPGCVIVDGWHRIAAGIILKIPKVKIEYGGRSDVEDYLAGKTDSCPEEILF